MRLTEYDDIIAAMLPNVVATVPGEASLIDKVAPYIDAAETEMVNNIVGGEVFDLLCEDESMSELRTTAARYALASALLTALPALDVVLTPNGFGVVSTNNIAPASTARIEALRASIIDRRDQAFEALIAALPALAEWREHAVSRYYTATIFRALTLIDMVYQPDDKRCRIDRYKTLRAAADAEQQHLADVAVSPELMQRLCLAAVTGEATAAENMLIERIKKIIALNIAGAKYNKREAVYDTVNYVKAHAADFPEWATSDVAALYNPPVFANDRNSGGYFF
ncbi:MAG: DUF6712 family protein [Muribaculaceae bacterium]